MAGALHYEWVEQQRRLHEERREPEPAWEEVGEIELLYGVPTALLLLGGAWWLLRRALGPVAELTRAAERIHLDNLRERLPRTNNGDELDRLTEVFNAMMERLEGSFARVREFTLHASHELKTPLTVMRAEIESTLRDEEIASSQRELLVNQLDEIQRLTKIVDGLTLLAKADAGQMVLHFETIEFDELVKENFADSQMLAQPQGISVQLPVCQEISLRGDRHRLRQLLLNLTDNAIKYNQPQGQVVIALRRNAESAELTISNTGPGIVPEKLPRVFDRFYRGDPAHSNEREGCGLGLSIAQWIVQSHGGSMKIESTPSLNTSVTVLLPLPSEKPPVYAPSVYHQGAECGTFL
jgi:heavy metal sensor kinase